MNSCIFASIQDIWENTFIGQENIPDIQRGLVWNAAQIEVFWDSLMRGIPIGIFTVVNNAGEKMLLDGQQRWHAIQCARNCDPGTDGILWVGMLDQEAAASLNLYNRKYLFRWTTQTHPWGFKIDNNEKQATRLSIGERRNVLAWNNPDYGNTLFQKPTPGDIQPFFCDKMRMVKFSSFFDMENPPSDWTEAQKQYWYTFQNTLMQVIARPIIPIMGIESSKTEKQRDFVEQNPTEHDADWVDTFFLRMNSQGTPFSPEELSYSALKSELAKLGIDRPRLLFEKMAKDYGNTSRIALISLQICMYEECGENFAKGWSAGEIKTFFSLRKIDKEKLQLRFEDIGARFAKLKEYCDNFNKATTNAAILPFHIATLPIDLLRYAIIVMNLKYGNYVETHSDVFLGSIFLILWFTVEKQRINDSIGTSNPRASVTRKLIEEFRNNPDAFDIPRIISDCIYQRWIIPPLAPTDLVNKQEEIYNNLLAYRFLSQEADNQLMELRLGSVFDWHRSKKFVTLACGKYLLNHFKCDIYNMQEDFIPWDYDHLLPQNLYTNENGKMCWSAGNCVPIALTTNRSKQDQLPGETYPDNYPQSQNQLYLDLSGVNEWGNNPTSYNRNAFERFTKMYKEVYTSMLWDKILSYLRPQNNYEILAQEIRDSVSGYDWYYVLDGREFAVSSPDDFRRYQVFVLRSAQDACMAINTHDFSTFYCGKRKPALQPMGRQVYWWLTNCEPKDKDGAIEWLNSNNMTKAQA